jgi:hypothetical protein
MNLTPDRGEMLRALAGYGFTPSQSEGALDGSMPVMGVFELEHRRNGKLIGRDIASNIVTTEGLNHILSTVVAGGSAVSPWYIALFEGNYTPVAGLTAATFTASATECTAYDEAARVAYVEGTPSGGVIDNAASRAVFTMNATKTIYGGALLSVSTKSSTSGTLLAAARFSSSRAVVDDDELSVRYSLTLTSS